METDFDMASNESSHLEQEALRLDGGLTAKWSESQHSQPGESVGPEEDMEGDPVPARSA